MKRVLIVDDDPVLRSVIREFLEDVGDFDIQEAGDGQQALELAWQVNPHVVLMDVRMPRLDGLSASRKLREQGFTQPIIVCSSYVCNGITEDVEAAGATGVLAKPFDLKKLHQMILTAN